MKQRNTLIDFTRLFDILPYQQEKYPQSKALNCFQGGDLRHYSTDEILKKADLLSCWFLGQGYQTGDRVAVVPLMGSPDWMIIDFACQQIGLILVPMHPTASLHEMGHILGETEARICITVNEGIYYKIQSLKKDLPQLEHIYHLDKSSAGYFQSLEGKTADKALLTEVLKIKAAITPEDLVCIMYTSGTSGIPKGVPLTHHNVVSNIKSILTLLPLQPKHRILSFLPFSHIFERTSCFAYMAFGVQVYFAQSLDTLSHDFNMVRPHLCTTVPRTLEKMYDIMEQRTRKGWMMKRKLILWAMDVGKRYKTKRSLMAFYGLKLFIARVLVLSQWRKKLGGRIRYMIVGAAALRPELGRLFSAGGIMTLTGYGMTETSPYLTANRLDPGLNYFGTVGIPVPGVQVRIDQPDEDGAGEIQVKGPNVMKGYYIRPELNSEVFTEDGWLRTGDIGKMVKKRFLTITDRKKDIFKTTSGKYIAPQTLENHFTASPFLSQCLIIGFNKPFVSAVLVPNFETLEAWCKNQGIHWTAPEYMVQNIKVVKKIQEEINEYNEQLQGYERVRKFILADKEWTVEDEDLSASFKVRRPQVTSRYQKELDKIYG